MAIALNTPNNGVSSIRVAPSVRRDFVQPGSIWDANGAPRGGLQYSGGVQGVRTLRVEHRTYSAVLNSRVEESARARAAVRTEKKRANRANYLVGAVFGCALFAGTVFAGLSGVAPEGDMSGTSTPETVQAVIAR